MASRSMFQVGDRVCIALSADTLKAKQTENGGWFSGMVECAGKEGVVKNTTSSGGVTVEFPRMLYTFNPSVLTKIPKLSIGETVRIESDRSKVHILQEHHGGWGSGMEQTLGKVGKVLRQDDDGNVVVGFGQSIFLFNPACCHQAPGATPDSIGAQPSLGRSSFGPFGSPGAGFGTQDSGGEQEELLGLLGGLMLLRELAQIRPPPVFFKAIIDGDLPTVKTMLSKKKELVKVTHDGATPLEMASHQGHVDIVRVLLEAGADLEARDNQGNRALGAAIMGKKLDVAKLLLEKGASPQVTFVNGGTYLHLAAMTGEADAVTLLIQKGCSVNAQDKAGDTPVHDAVTRGNTAAVAALVASSSLDLTIKNVPGFTALHLACRKGDAVATELIAKKNKSAVNLQKSDGYAALHLAAFNDNGQCIEKLVMHGGADLELKENEGRTALHLACLKTNEDAAKILIKHGANVKAVSTNGHTPLHFVMNAGNTVLGAPLLALLLESRVKDEVQVSLACFLLEKGAILDALDSDGNTPWDYCHSPSVKSRLETFVRAQPSGVIKHRVDSPSSGAAEFSRPSTGAGPRRPGTSICKVCSRDFASITVEPCDHKVMCRACSLRTEACPQCGARIQRRLQSVGERPECIVQ